MPRNPLDGVPPSEELLQRAAEAIVREWSDWGGCTEATARDAVERLFVDRRRLGPELADERARDLWVEPVIDLTAPGPEWTVYLDHGERVLGRVESG